MVMGVVVFVVSTVTVVVAIAILAKMGGRGESVFQYVERRVARTVSC